MKQGLFNKKAHEPQCAQCEHGKYFEGDGDILCKKFGIVQPEDFCKKFKYDPLKRSPAKINIKTDFKKEDFEI